MMKLQGSILLLLVIAAQSVRAYDGFIPSRDCGQAKVISGNTCSNVKVEFDLTSCGVNEDHRIAKKIICTGNVIKARFDGNDRHEAEFSKESDGWGGIKWTAQGSVKHYIKVPSKTAVVRPIETREIASTPISNPPSETKVSPNETSTASASQPVATPGLLSSFKFGAFFDLRYTNYSSGSQLNNPHAESGFGLEDGAIYVNYEKDRFSVVADLPFRRAKDLDYSSTAAIPNESQNPNFMFGADRAQLYAKYKILESLSVDLGQFDTIFGVEVNDSKDRVFGKTGIVYDYMIPVVHQGLMLEFSKNGFYAKAFGANPNNKGSYATSNSGDTNTEYGAAIGYSNDWIRGQIGYMTRPIAKAGDGSMSDHSLADLTLGTTLGAFSLDLEYAYLKDPSKDTLTSDLNDQESAGTGALAIASYKFNDLSLAGLRYEHISNDPGAAKIQTGDSYGASFNYKLTSELELRAAYINYLFKSTTGNAWVDNRAMAGAVVTL